MANDDLHALSTVLDMEYHALRRGDFSDLESIAERKEAMASSLALIADHDPVLLREIAGKARRNEACLLAASRGLRAARRRLAELREASAGLNTYDQHGRRAGLPKPHKTIERRA